MLAFSRSAVVVASLVAAAVGQASDSDFPPGFAAQITTGEAAEAAGPQVDTNFGIQLGQLEYLPSYLALRTPPFGNIAGKSAMFRMATGSTRLSVSFGVGLSGAEGGVNSSDLATMQFQFKVHSEPCLFAGGAVYQHPYLCVDGCSPAEVATARITDVPLELDLRVQVDNSNFNEASIQATWPVHIPAGDSAEMSVVMYDPTNPGVRMVCADLRSDRQMEGLIFKIFEERIEDVPVIDISLSRHELGLTDVTVRAANLRPSFTYRAFVHSLPCAPLSPGASGGESGGGDRYMRDDSCYGRIGTPGCEASVDTQMWIQISSDERGFHNTQTRFLGLASADAQSVLLKDCTDASGVPDPTGECAGGEPTLMCIDLVDEIATIVSSSSAGPDLTVPPVELTNSPTPAPTTGAPTTGTPTTGVPTTGVPTTGVPTSMRPTPSPLDPPSTREPTPPPTLAPSTSEPTRTITTTVPPSTAVPGDIKDPINRVGPTNRPTSLPTQWRGKSPCPHLEAYYHRSGKGKHGLGHKHQQLDFSPISDGSGFCCMDPNGPGDGLVGLAYARYGTKGVTQSLVGIVAGVAGGILIAGGITLQIYRKRRESRHQQRVADEDYAVPLSH